MPMEPVDELAIRALAHDYFDAVDRGDGDGVAALFTVDGELTMTRPAGSDGPVGSRSGRGPIAEQTNWLAQKYRLTAHTLASHAIDVSEGHVTGRVRCVAHHLSQPDQAPTDRVVYLRYYDDYVNTDGRWLFSRRVLNIELAAVYLIST
jgi:uncharacterized protein (TIGR02246 family)